MWLNVKIMRPIWIIVTVHMSLVLVKETAVNVYNTIKTWENCQLVSFPMRRKRPMTDQ